MQPSFACGVLLHEIVFGTHPLGRYPVGEAASAMLVAANGYLKGLKKKRKKKRKNKTSATATATATASAGVDDQHSDGDHEDSPRPQIIGAPRDRHERFTNNGGRSRTSASSQSRLGVGLFSSPLLQKSLGLGRSLLSVLQRPLGGQRDRDRDRDGHGQGHGSQ